MPFTLAEELRWQTLAPATVAQVQEVRARYLDIETFPKARAWLARPAAARRLADTSAAIGERLERLLRERRGPFSLVDDPEARARFAAIAGRLATPDQAAEATATGLAVARFLLPPLALQQTLPQIKAELETALREGRAAFEARIAEALTPERVTAEFGLGIDDAQAAALAPAVEARRKEIMNVYDALAAYLVGPAEAGLRPLVDAVLEDLEDAAARHASTLERLRG